MYSIVSALLTGEENGKPLQYSCLENPMNSMKRQKDGLKWVNLTQMTIISTTVGKNPLEEMK